ncbi:MAG: hypothetical protein PHO37_05350 [Kiritimatiellae bacterium]|nr:hypothetical protein [Kiritimatiellia bacterium]
MGRCEVPSARLKLAAPAVDAAAPLFERRFAPGLSRGLRRWFEGVIATTEWLQ